MIVPVLDHVDATLETALARLKELLRIESISTDPAHKIDCQAAAEWLTKDLQSFGAEASVRPTEGMPMVLGHAGEGAAHLLFYGHYDVQPVDPLDLWDSPPFEPKIEDTPNGKVIRARGASDDKGQLMTFVEACRAWHAVHGTLPARITFFFEGEEESGYPNMLPFIRANKDELRADIALVCDTALSGPDLPAIPTQLRGMLKEEFVLTGTTADLHSGQYGGPGINALREMARIVTSFYDDQGRVAVDGFYDGVHETPPALLEQWEAIGLDHDAYLANAGLTQSHGEHGYSLLEQQWARPTLEVNGMWGGYTAPGVKTVIPSQAHCKISCRLVGDMDPEDIRQKIHAHVAARLGPDLSVEWTGTLKGVPAVVMDTSKPAFQAARKALSAEWPRDAVFTGTGGSIPLPGMFKEELGMDALLIGFAQADDKIHSPNEKYDVKSFHKGIRSWVRVLDALSR